METDIVIIGAGAAGLMCAMTAARRGRRVLVLEHNDRPGRKILISGGGKCNFTNRNAGPECYVSHNPHFARSALKRYTPQNFLDLLATHAIPWHERDHGQLFCDRSAADIVNVLVEEAVAAGATIECNVSASHVVPTGEEDQLWLVETSAGPVRCQSVVLATGGLSIPKIGASNFTLRVAEQLGIPVLDTYPGLVPLVFGEDDLAFMRPLTGIALDATATCGKTRFREALLFTHRGLSGPVILQISSFWKQGDPVCINLCPDRDIPAWLAERRDSRPKARLHTVISEILPNRLAQSLCERAGMPDTVIGQTGNKTLSLLADQVQAWTVYPTGTEGYRTAEVMGGGIDTNALSSRTMEVKAQPGLYIIGEAVDVTGWLGGYNFQWAWASGHAAGEVA